MRIAVAGSINLVNDPARDMGFIRTRDQRAVEAGFGYFFFQAIVGGVAGDQPSLAIRRVAAGTRAIHVPWMAFRRSTTGNLSVRAHNAAIAGETIVVPTNAANRNPNRPNAPDARVITWANLASTGQENDFRVSITANDLHVVEDDFQIDADNTYILIQAPGLGIGSLQASWRWYEE